MFIDKKLNNCFNKGLDKQFIQRLLHISKNNIQQYLYQSHLYDECVEYAIEKLHDYTFRHTGYVYIAGNDLHPDLIKIGRTKNIEDRQKSLNNESVIGNTKIYWFIQTIDSYMLETFVHQRLKQYRSDKEFYYVDVDLAMELIQESNVYVQQFFDRIQFNLRNT